MNSAQSKPTTMRHYRSQRAATDSATITSRLALRVGFTLVELLMVILIIGILVAMLAVAINPVLQTARETAVITEMKQLDLACLLYTSPSPRDQRGSRMPSSA